MAKLTLSDLTNLNNPTTAVATINANSAATETALEKTLSRDGTSPNQMDAQLDMNSNRIINLGAPTSLNDAVRLRDLTGDEVVVGTFVEFSFATIAAAEAADIPGTVYGVHVQGYANAGDGGEGLYHRVGSEPTHLFKFQSNDGAWWELDYSKGVNLRQGGAGLGDSARDELVMESALTLGTGTGASRTGVTIYAPRGSYSFTRGFDIVGNYTTIKGDGKGATVFFFTPTADGETLFNIYNADAAGPSGSGIAYVVLSDFMIFSADALYRKNGIIVQNATQCTLRNIIIQTLVSPGQDSYGIISAGREFLTIEDCYVGGNNPLAFTLNPDRATYGALIDTDLAKIWRSSFVVAPIDPSVTKPCIIIQNGVHASRMSLKEVWCAGGGSAFFWADASSTTSHQGLSIDGLYYEQNQQPGSFTIYIDFTGAAVNLRQVSLKNIHCATECGGIALLGLNGANKRIQDALIDGVFYASTGLAMQLDAGIDNLDIRNYADYAGSGTLNIGGLTLRQGSFWRAGTDLPGQGSYASSTRQAPVWYGAPTSAMHVGVMHYNVSLTDDASATLTAFSDFDVRSARITVNGNTQAGCAVFFEGAALTQGWGTANFDIADTDTKLCVIRTSDTNVTVKNRLGATQNVMITVEFLANPSL